MSEPIFSRDEQLEAVVDRLPDWYFAATQVLQQSPIQSDALGLSSSFYAALGPVCETEDKPQPMDEDDLLKPRDPPSNAALSCSDDELEAATQHHQIRQQQLGQSTASRSTASSSGGCTDLVLSGFSMRGREKKVIRTSYSDFEDLHSQLTEILENRQAYYRSKALSRLARGVAPVPADARTQEDKLERAITAFALLPTLRQRF
ncbi:hypothetical protein PF002_g31093 [Phytophthora fragariae]|uniref:PX domain-containing protein n=3 Tax=Phytophthora fragariae TaxID=53985 RepID=A0A6A3VFF3_9STRA|nr:hypothetical protein PF002_g31093 [Phytophthora fragariae]